MISFIFKYTFFPNSNGLFLVLIQKVQTMYQNFIVQYEYESYLWSESYFDKHLQLAPIRMVLSFSSISQPRLHQFQLALWPSSRGGLEDSKTPTTCSLDDFEPSYGTSKKAVLRQLKIYLYFEQTWISWGFL